MLRVDGGVHEEVTARNSSKEGIGICGSHSQKNRFPTESKVNSVGK